MIVFLNTQMRVGSTWLIGLLSNLLGVKWEFWAKGGSVPEKKFRTKGIKLVKLHWANPKTISEGIKNRKNSYCIILTRNLYDIIVSGIFYMRYDKPLTNIKRLKDIKQIKVKFNEENEKLKDRKYINKFIQTEQDHIKKRFVEPYLMYNNEYKHPKLLKITYEDMKEDVFKVLNNICFFLGLEKSEKDLKKIVAKNSFKSVTGRKPGNGDNKAFRRRGVVGDWENWLNEKSIEVINKLLKSKK